jgi:UDP-N-acetylglucosamine 1-carboxyvinyltransferase
LPIGCFELKNCNNGELLSAAIWLDGGDAIVEGPLEARATEWAIPDDRIVWGTVAMASAITGGEIWLPVQSSVRIESIAMALDEAGIEIAKSRGGLRVRGGPTRPFAVRTGPYPAFPSDLVPITISMMTQAPGTSHVIEQIYPDRFAHRFQLERMGARITVQNRIAAVTGVTRLKGCLTTNAGGIRETAALLVAALAARGRSLVRGYENLARGYDDLVGSLRALGGSCAPM